MRNSTIAIIIVAGLALVALAGFAVQRVWLSEPEIASGPLSAELIAALNPGDRSQDLGAEAALHLSPDASLVEKQAVLAANGFACVQSDAMVEGAHYLTCDRPLPGSGFCEGISYYSYETADGDIIDTTVATYEQRGSASLLGVCQDRRTFYLDALAIAARG